MSERKQCFSSCFGWKREFCNAWLHMYAATHSFNVLEILRWKTCNASVGKNVFQSFGNILLIRDKPATILILIVKEWFCNAVSNCPCFPKAAVFCVLLCTVTASVRTDHYVLWGLHMSVSYACTAVRKRWNVTFAHRIRDISIHHPIVFHTAHILSFHRVTTVRSSRCMTCPRFPKNRNPRSWPCIIVLRSLNFMHGLAKNVQFHVTNTSAPRRCQLVRKRHNCRQKTVWMFQWSGLTLIITACLRSRQR